MMSFLRRYSLLLVFFGLQVGFWGMTHNRLPEMDIVPDVPGRTAVKALSFGDEEFYFRLLALDIQNAGDTFGRFTELYKYDFQKLYAWFMLLESLNNQSDYMPFIASYYFSQTQYVPDVKYVIDYLYEYSSYRPEQKYWWLAQAVYLAQHKLKDNDLALKMAEPLEHAYNAPYWVRQLPAFVHEKRGEMDDAYHIIEDIEKNSKNIPPAELRFMTYFVEERLKKMEKIRQGDEP
ncbi:MAG TPA: hypothetical protein VFT64_10955 [Rickettsiales bacterium]|nr:hypothetical protein [Rickettsiales bacterium]